MSSLRPAWVAIGYLFSAGATLLSARNGFVDSTQVRERIVVFPSNSAEFIQGLFDSAAVKGTFVLHKIGTDTTFVFDKTRAETRFLPASTFKIFNSMVALDAGSIADTSTVLTWDGTMRSVPAWNADQNMRQAFRNSTVWFYQEVARRTGPEKMKAWLERERYGNGDISGGIDAFWLIGGLRISALEQCAFLERLYRRQLGFSRRAQDIAYAILVWEKADGYVLRGKTGWTESNGNQLGWVVGFVERGGENYIYAMNFESPDKNYPVAKERERILREILGHVDVLPGRS